MSSEVNSVVSVRLVSADYYMSSPVCGLDCGYSAYRGLEIRKVPVIRVFGSTSTGYKVCLHIHNVLPYFYIPYDGSIPPDKMGHQIVMALDKAINVLQGQGSSTAHHIFKASLVSGIPIYGFHRKEHQLFKVYFYNPVTRKHSYDLFLNGAVLNKTLQPCEAHIPFILQFLIDFNLQGMNYIRLKSALARRTPVGVENFSQSKADPISTCEMELDCSAEDILNSLDVQDGVLMNPGLAALWEEEIQRRRVKNMNLDNLSPPASQIRSNILPTSSHLFYKNNLEEKMKEFTKDMNNVSMSFCEVNEHLETSLAIETPEIKDLLSASSIDFHGRFTKQPTPAQSEGDPELLNILCELADDHDTILQPEDPTANSSATTPLIDYTSANDDEPLDEDSILGTQISKVSHASALSQTKTDVEDFSGESDGDDDRETLEMTQIFSLEEFPHIINDSIAQRVHLMEVPKAADIFPELEDDSNSTITSEFTLPNLDGAHDSSSDEDKAKLSDASKTSRKYKPLVFRPTNVKVKTSRNESIVSDTTVQSVSSTLNSLAVSSSFIEHEESMLLFDDEDNSTILAPNNDTRCSDVICESQFPLNDFSSPPKEETDDYTDALFAMSFFSPQPDPPQDSPPRPGTPNMIDSAQVVIRPLLEDISTYEGCTGLKLKMTGKVVLKSLEDEVKAYNLTSRRKLRVPPEIDQNKKPGRNSRVTKRKQTATKNKKMAKKAKNTTEGQEEKTLYFETTILEKSTHSTDDLHKTQTTTISEVSLTDQMKARRNSRDESLGIENKPAMEPEILIDKNVLEIQYKNSVSVNSREDEDIVEKKNTETYRTQEKAFLNRVETDDQFENDLEKILGNVDRNSSTDVAEECRDVIMEVERDGIDGNPVPEADQQDPELGSTTEEDEGENTICEQNSEGLETGPTFEEMGSSQKILSQRPSSVFQPSDDSHPASYDSFKTWNMVTSEDSSSLTEQPIISKKEDVANKSIVEEIVVREQLFVPGAQYNLLIDAPTRNDVISSLDSHGIPSHDNGAPFWGDAKDEVKLKDVRGKSLIIESKLVRSLPEFGSTSFPQALINNNSSFGTNRIILTTLNCAPTRESVSQWLEKQSAANITLPRNDGKSKKKRTDHEDKQRKDRSQLEAPTLNNSYGFRVSLGNFIEAKTVHQYQHLTVMSMELHISTRQSLQPDPEFDAVEAVFFTLTNDVPVDSLLPEMLTAVIVVDDSYSAEAKNRNSFSRTGVVDIEMTIVENELALFREVFKLIRKWDPDIILGYEIEMLSWGYLLHRGVFLGLAMSDLLSRIPGSGGERANKIPEDLIEGGYMVEKNSDISVLGRIVLNLWRLLRVEIAVQSYTFENMVFHILHRRIPNYNFEKLSSWWKSNHERWQVIEHYLTRVRGNMQLIEQLDIIGRTSELARLFGIQFYEVFTRGSQFRVESMMLRLAKPKNFVAVSPSVTQRSRMKAPEWLPLIMEPESRFYTDPVLVLDFQSLYPSMIIAYNYCYSTCLGRAHHLGKNEPFDFGCTQLLIPPDIIQDLLKKDLINISPAGVVFVKPEVRTGILPQMLSEILNTRIMVKQSMKEYKGDNTLRRVFESRQLGLKLIANVTYGYTSANFSGRMPCVELGDSVVSKGRETLERAIHLIESRPDWKARVIYGDTDSVFVLLPGRSKDDAFVIGAEIADAVTQTNPQPVKLKFEKVYHPCILQTKKRYVGYKYETPDQKDPVYEAKGIETVRRDGCPAVVKLLERSLRVLFESHDVSKVKTYIQRQFSKILQNRISIQDFIFAKEYRGRQGYKPGACVPALEIAKNQLKNDRRSEARIGERVPYIVVYGSPGVPLIRLVIPAQQLLQDNSLRLNAHYYITRAIVPALQRCLGLLGVDVMSWYQSLPRVSTSLMSGIGHSEQNFRKATISQYFGSATCLLCDEPISSIGLCATCLSSRQTTAFSLASLLRLSEKDYLELVTLCQSCTGSVRTEQFCTSIDCPILYRRVKAFNQLQMVSKLSDKLSTL